ncbi:MAG: hypothetical protein IPH48_18935 [bacterium]|nr:hypothetical protein [bacterium]
MTTKYPGLEVHGELSLALMQLIEEMGLRFFVTAGRTVHLAGRGRRQAPQAAGEG